MMFLLLVHLSPCPHRSRQRRKMAHHCWSHSSIVRKTLLGRYFCESYSCDCFYFQFQCLFQELSLNLSVLQPVLFDDIYSISIYVSLYILKQWCIFQISIEPVQGKKVEHNGIKVELLGQIGQFTRIFRDNICLTWIDVELSRI